MNPILRVRNEAVSPVVAELLLITITVVVAALLYVMVSGLISGHTDTRPVIALGPVPPFSGPSYNVSLGLAGASQTVAVYNYKFNLQVNGTVVPPVNFAPSHVPANITVGTTTYQVTWQDVSGNGMLSQGDDFLIAGKGVSLPPKTSFEFLILWSDGTVLTTASWTTP